MFLECPGHRDGPGICVETWLTNQAPMNGFVRRLNDCCKLCLLIPVHGLVSVQPLKRASIIAVRVCTRAPTPREKRL
jgi:hypothetical protein